MSADRAWIVVGAPYNDDNGVDSGHVQVFNYNAILNRYVQIGSAIVGQLTGDLFGDSVEISGSSTTFVVGAPYYNERTGQARIFRIVVPTMAPTKLSTKAPTKAPVPITQSTMSPTLRPSLAPVIAPMDCGLFGLNLFCPRRGNCGFFRRLLSINGCN